jgi:outer membrane protein OmpA-like peptidoglycan-associated protein
MAASRIPLSILFLTCSLWLPAQEDLVPNGSFDVPKGKLKRMGSIEMAKGWTSPTPNYADLFSARIEDAPMSAPRNQYGTQDPRKGEHYAGIRTYSQHGRDSRSYVQTPLTRPMAAGEKFCVTYYMSLADLSKFSNAGISAFFSKVSVKKDEPADLGFDAQVPAKPRMINSLTDWQPVCGIYQAEGGEEYLIIGNFQTNDKTTTEKIRRPKGEVRAQLQYAYYYIDDVSVRPIRHANECECESADRAKSEFIFGRSGFAGADLETSAKVGRQVFYFKRFQSNIDSSMEPWVKEMAELMQADAGVRVKLTGHIDEIEQDRTEVRTDLLKLGEERAAAIKKALEGHGIDGGRITVAPTPENILADASGTEVGMSKNRRVVVEVVK